MNTIRPSVSIRRLWAYVVQTGTQSWQVPHAIQPNTWLSRVSFIGFPEKKFSQKKTKVELQISLCMLKKHMKPFCSLDLWMKDDERMKEYLDSFTPEIVFFFVMIANN